MKEKAIYKRLLYIFILLLLLLVMFYVYISDPVKGPILPCGFNLITGHKCPGCGMTRAVNSIMHGDPIAAFGYNKLILLIPIGLIIYLVFKIIGKNTEKLIWLYIIIVILYAVIRNI